MWEKKKRRQIDNQRFLGRGGGGKKRRRRIPEAMQYDRKNYLFSLISFSCHNYMKKKKGEKKEGTQGSRRKTNLSNLSKKKREKGKDSNNHAMICSRITLKFGFSILT